MRTLCGSIGLIGAVPLTTALAASILPPVEAVHEGQGARHGHDHLVKEVDETPRWEDFAPEDPME